MKRIFLKALISVPLCLAVVTSLIAAEPWIEVAGGKWDPSPQVLADLKAQIESYVRFQAKAQGRKLKNWQDYTFQYQGQEEKGRKFIFINALCVQTDRQRLIQTQLIYCHSQIPDSETSSE
jgi:hypothetical protein